MKNYHIGYTNAYIGNNNSHQDNVAAAKTEMRIEAEAETAASNAAFKAREAAVKAADSNPHA